MRNLRQRGKTLESSYKESQISVCQTVICNQFVGLGIKSVAVAIVFRFLKSWIECPHPIS